MRTDFKKVIFLYVFSAVFGVLVGADAFAQRKPVAMGLGDRTKNSSVEGTINEEVVVKRTTRGTSDVPSDVSIRPDPTPFGIVRMFNGHASNQFGNTPGVVVNPKDFMISHGDDYIARGYKNIIFQLPWGLWRNSGEFAGTSPWGRSLNMYESAPIFYHRTPEWQQGFKEGLEHFQTKFPNVKTWIYTGCYIPDGDGQREMTNAEFERYFGFMIDLGLDGISCDNSSSGARDQSYYFKRVIPWLNKHNVAFVFEAFQRPAVRQGYGEREVSRSHKASAFALFDPFMKRVEDVSVEPKWTVDDGEMPVFAGILRSEGDATEEVLDWLYDSGMVPWVYGARMDESRDIPMRHFVKRTVCSSDITRDGVVDRADIDAFVSVYSRVEKNNVNPNINRKYDLNHDTRVDSADAEKLQLDFGKTCPEMMAGIKAIEPTQIEGVGIK